MRARRSPSTSSPIRISNGSTPGGALLVPVVVSVAGLRRRRTRIAVPVDRKVAESGGVAEPPPHRAAHRLEGAGLEARHAATTVADEVLTVAFAGERVQPGTVADVHVTDHPELLEPLEVAVHGGELERRGRPVP